MESTIVTGQQYRSTQSDHLGWLVEVKHVSPLQIRTVGLAAPIYNREQAFPIAGFLRDWELVKDVKPVSTSGTQTHRICKVCQIDFPLNGANYQLVTINRGNNKGQTGGYFKTCRTCVAAAKTKGIRAGVKARQQQQTHRVFTPAPQTVKSTAATTTLSSQLLALAAQAETLELAVRPEYQNLLTVARSLATEAEYAHGILVIKRETFDKLETALKALSDEMF